MDIDVFDQNPWGTNYWVLSTAESNQVVIVDLGFGAAEVFGRLENHGKQLAAIVLTHAHVDHAREAGILAGDDVPVYIHTDDAIAFTDIDAWNPGFGNPLEPVADLRTLTHGQVLDFDGFSLETVHTPGHTPGHCAFLTDAQLFAGDLVFAGSVGRTDFANGDAEAMRASLGWFVTLRDDLPVYPGHGPATSVGRERAENPFLQGLVV
ncbi:MAG: hydroxyacylglutathione hydrolase [Actinomycetota bacterium]|jgi:glyoxylase-like metal-dependent hydrolase (beta-lactamase superfamily II)|nr:hydroxyacylglutathione hydrolase [Actinomycetota bacterium]